MTDTQALVAAQEEVVAAELRVLEEVRNARRHGASWTEVGSAFGITRQSAWEKYSPLMQERRQCPIDGTEWDVNPDAPTTCPTCVPISVYDVDSAFARALADALVEAFCKQGDEWEETYAREVRSHMRQALASLGVIGPDTGRLVLVERVVNAIDDEHFPNHGSTQDCRVCDWLGRLNAALRGEEPA